MKNIFLKRSIALFMCLTLVISICNVSTAKAKTINDNSLIGNATIFNEEIANDPEVSLINSIAEAYYNYFIDNKIAEEEIYEIATSITTTNELLELPTVSINSISPSISVSSDVALDYSYYVKEVTGYTFSLSQIGVQLAALGVKLNLASALPFLEFLALIAGGVILTLAIAYSAIAVGVNDLILTWYQFSSVNLTAAKQNTRLL